jgi:membrane dipeptidase
MTTEKRALELHNKAIIIDTMYPDPKGVIPAGIFGDIYSTDVQQRVADMCRDGSPFRTVFQMLENQVVTDPGTHKAIMESIGKSGITAGSITQGGIFGDPYFTYDGALSDLADWVRRFDRLRDIYMKVTKAQDIRTAKQENRVGLIFNFQNTTHIGNDLSTLDFFHGLGIRVIQLTYNLRNAVGDGCTERTDSGLSRLGLDLIARMNTLGIVIDLSHCGHTTAMEAVNASKSPVAFTHINCKSIHNHPRNKTDDELRAVAENGGYVGITGHPMFLGNKSTSTVSNLVDHIEYAANLIGVDHIGIGSDFSGISHYPEEVMIKFIREDIHAHGWREEDGVKAWKDLKEGLSSLKHWNMDYTAIIREMMSRGHSDDDIEKIVGGNFLRFFEKVVG